MRETGNMESWVTEISETIDKNLESVKEKDKRFFRVDEFKRNIGRTSEFAGECSHCRNSRDSIVQASSAVLEAIQVPGKKRREYDKLIGDLSKHMRKAHGFYPPYYFSYIFAFWGFLAGALLGFVISEFVTDTELAYSIGFAICIVVAYIIGSVKDSKIRSAHKLL